MEIQPYSEIYQQQVVDLILTIQQTEFDMAIDINAQPDLENISAIYQKGNGNFWIVLIDDMVVGSIALLDIGNHCGALRKMFVKKEFRGSSFGVGQALLNTLIKRAGEKGFDKILLGTTEKFLAAQRFYEKNGFKEINKVLLPEEFPIMPVDVKFYQYNLNTNLQS